MIHKIQKAMEGEGKYAAAAKSVQALSSEQQQKCFTSHPDKEIKLL